MIVVVCPGIHPPALTQQFIAGLEQAIAIQPPSQAAVDTSLKRLNLWAVPSHIPSYAPDLIHDFVTQRWQEARLLSDVPTAWIGFSAGVVGAALAARRWQRAGGKVRGLIAIDGWGVPLGDAFPRFRLGHDRFTAQSCEWLGRSDGYFYCDPAVEHLDLWRSPQQATGQWQPHRSDLASHGKSLCWEDRSLGQAQFLTAAELLAQLLTQLSCNHN